jgi:hypothetical protein
MGLFFKVISRIIVFSSQLSAVSSQLKFKAASILPIAKSNLLEFDYLAQRPKAES